MRLLHVETLQFGVYLGEDIPPYAILSHTWGDQEVSFQEVCELQEWKAIPSHCRPENPKVGVIRAKPGYRKIVEFIREVSLYEEVKYVWIDTCCIDKSSSAELQEAINSMFRWYAQADVCYAYLSDVLMQNDGKLDSSSFRVSRWFTRGWTLQELLAPKEVSFFDRKWNHLLARNTDADTNGLIESITGIDQKFLRGDRVELIFEASIATRMSWAAHRKTTREEDMAYSLLGIFDISMPMLYGEGKRAFGRLQEEIMKVSDDPSLLAWGFTDSMDPALTFRGDDGRILARSPELFRYCGKLRPWEKSQQLPSSFATTQKGFELRLAIKLDPNHSALCYGIINCGLDSEDNDDSNGSIPQHQQVREYLAIPFISTSAWKNQLIIGEFARADWLVPQLVSKAFTHGATVQTIWIPRNQEIGPKLHMSLITAGDTLHPLLRAGYSIAGVYPPEPHLDGTIKYLSPLLQHKSGRDLCVKIYHLRRGEQEYLLIYDYELRWSEGVFMPYTDRNGPCSVYNMTGLFTLEFALAVATDKYLRNRLGTAILEVDRGAVNPNAPF
ncbi:hypothetical protein BP5796_09590 [Coleophoma crateriformis]|uniref:Heterokaryon incompatibility domain-containing protein n=1 Tax=Coleophoma crateriformis TaxID=565419 RepID=A0A3D8QYT5_9HELO|nr:hypothetical protein BP5796_09590 [Coleophoma crateriformis]